MRRFNRLLIAFVIMAVMPITALASSVNNVTSEGVDGNLVFYDVSKNEIFTIDATNRRLSIPSGSLLYLAATTIGLRGITYTLPAADGAASQFLQTNGSGTLSWATGGATAYDDIAKPDADKTITFDNDVITTWTFADVNEDMFTIQGLGAFGDVSIVKIEQKTGNATDGTVLEVVSADTDVDPLVVTANSANRIQVYGSGNVDIVGLTGVINYTDFDVDADGKVTISSDDGGSLITLSPSAAAVGIDASNATLTTAIDVGANDIVGTTGLINLTNFDVDASGNIVSAGDVTAVDGTFSGNVNITGTFQQDSITASTAATTLTVDGTGVGGVTIGGTSTGTVTLGGGTKLVDLPSTVDMTISGGDFAVTDTANADMVTFTNNTMTTADLVTLSATGTRTSDNVIEIADGATTATTIGITANTQTSGYGISYANSGAALTGAAINLAVTDGAGFTGDYIRCYDGSAEDFTVERYGEVTIAGNAGADMLTITAGNIQLTDGDIDVDDGFIAVNSDEDHASNFTRNFDGAGTSPVVTIADSHASSTNSALTVTSAGSAGTALRIDQTGVNNAIGIDLNVAGDYPAIDIDASAARDGDVIDILMTNMVDERALNITGAWTGATSEGLIEINTTAAGTIPAGQLLRLDQNGTGQHAAAIEGSVLYMADAATAPAAGTSYAVTIDATNIEALHVDTGKALFDEQPTFTAGIDADGAVDIDLATNADLVNITNAAADLTAGDGVTTIYGSNASGQTNASYLLRLAWKANGDAQDNFILCEDNSTGAAGNGDDMFKVDTGGSVTAAAAISAGTNLTAGGLLTTTPQVISVTTEANLTITGTIVVLDGDNDSDNDTVDLQNPTAAGQILIIVAGTGVDADDTISLNYGDTTCTNCAACTLNKENESCSYVAVSETEWAPLSAPNTSL